MPVLKKNAVGLTFFQAFLDSCWVLLAFFFAAHMTYSAAPETTFQFHFWRHAGYFVLYIVFWCVAGADQHLFASRRNDPLGMQLWAVCKTVVISLVFTGFAIGFFRRELLERDFLLYFGLGCLVLQAGFRTLVRLFLWTIRSRGYNFRQILVVGANERSKHLLDVALGHSQYGYHLAGVLDDTPDRVRYLKEYDVPYLGTLDDLEQVLLRHVIDEVYIGLPVRTYYESILSMAHLCEGIGVPVRLIADLFPLRIATSRVSQLEDIPLLSLSTIPEAQSALLLKRFIDLSVSFFGLLFLVPLVFVPVAVLIKLESPGPVFFAQERVGQNRRRFKMLKFRSMVQDAEKKREELQSMNEADGPVFKIKHDPRITRIGRFIRKTSIDELPQLINVLVGQMSLVGPRPPIPSEVEEYTWDQRRRLSVKPGMTGLWQVSGRSEVTFQQWVEMDLAYIDSWSLALDFRIIMKTFRVVALGKGAA